MKKIDLTGKKFGRLLVVSEIGERKNRRIYWRCQCDCGNIVMVVGADLKNGTTQSCGCLQKEIVRKSKTKHGMCYSSTYLSWLNMRRRCNEPENISFKNYGGRGITVCERWAKFENFLEDLGEKPVGLTLERLNNDKGYSPGNCAWRTYAEQNRNQRIQKNNKTGIAGIYYGKKRQKYRVFIAINHKRFNIGCFSNLEDAKIARIEAEQKYWGR